EREGYDVTYATDIDLNSLPGLLTKRAAFLSVGHDEYWSKPMHDNVLLARENGKHLGFFSGNSVFWIINVLPSCVPSGQQGRPNRRLQTFKDDTAHWLWQNCAVGGTNAPRCDDAQHPEQSEQTLVGSITTDGNEDRGDIQFDFNDLQKWPVPQWVLDMLQGSQLHDGTRIAGIIGHEGQTICGLDTQRYSDCYLYQQLRPRRPTPDNQTRLAHSQFKARRHDSPSPEYLFSDMSVYQSKTKGAWVFSTGSSDWSLALDVYTSNYQVSPDY